jgi:hypothetical protein
VQGEARAQGCDEAFEGWQEHMFEVADGRGKCSIGAASEGQHAAAAALAALVRPAVSGEVRQQLL